MGVSIVTSNKVAGTGTSPQISLANAVDSGLTPFAQAGDVLCVFLNVWGTQAITTATGMTRITTGSWWAKSFTAQTALYYRVLATSDQTWTWTLGSSVNYTMYYVIIRGVGVNSFSDIVYRTVLGNSSGSYIGVIDSIPQITIGIYGGVALWYQVLYCGTSNSHGVNSTLWDGPTDNPGVLGVTTAYDLQMTGFTQAGTGPDAVALTWSVANTGTTIPLSGIPASGIGTTWEYITYASSVITGDSNAYQPTSPWYFGMAASIFFPTYPSVNSGSNALYLGINH
jgi:hypothetical protein